MGFATDAIHVGQEPEPRTGAIVAPIFQTSTYVQEKFGKYREGYDYARTNHPNRKALERCVAKLEGGQSAYVFSSGMAGIDAVFRLLRPGDHATSGDGSRRTSFTTRNPSTSPMNSSTSAGRK